MKSSQVCPCLHEPVTHSPLENDDAMRKEDRQGIGSFRIVPKPLDEVLEYEGRRTLRLEE